MSVRIEIQGTVIQFPSSGNPQNWAPALVEFAQLVESAISVAVGAFDIPSQTFNIDVYDIGGTDIPNLIFDNTQVRSASVIISCYRTYDSPSTIKAETATIDIVYNPANPSTEKWEIAVERVGNSSITYSISDDGQFSFSCAELGTGGTHTGVLSYSAKALTQV
jgi:hypothetical protein